MLPRKSSSKASLSSSSHPPHLRLPVPLSSLPLPFFSSSSPLPLTPLGPPLVSLAVYLEAGLDRLRQPPLSWLPEPHGKVKPPKIARRHRTAAAGKWELDIRGHSSSGFYSILISLLKDSKLLSQRTGFDRPGRFSWKRKKKATYLEIWSMFKFAALHLSLIVKCTHWCPIRSLFRQRLKIRE